MTLFSLRIGLGIASASLLLACGPSQGGAADSGLHEDIMQADAPKPSEGGRPPTDAGAVGEASVLTGHLHLSRDGAYVEPLVTQSAAAKLTLDTSFKATYFGQTYAQPLYVEGIKPGHDAIFVVTQTNEVASFDAKTGATLWAKSLGPFVPPAALPCGQPPSQQYGILSTPVIDPETRTLYVEGFVSGDDDKSMKQLAYALSIDDGNLRPGWPIDIGKAVPGFNPIVQHQRGSLLLLDGTLYLPFSGIAYDCGNYHGWVVGISTPDPTKVTAYSSSANKGGIWGALTSDGESLFFASGNTAAGTTTWGGGEAVIRLPPSLEFSGSTKDYFAPSNWQVLDNGDYDLGSASLVLFDLPGVGSGSFAFAAGKYGTAHLVDRTNLGGIGKGDGVTGEGLFSTRIVPLHTPIEGNPASYTTTKGTYVVLRADGLGTACPKGTMGDLMALKIAATNPPTFSVAWCAVSHGLGSPMVTTTDGKSEPVVWVVSAQATNLLYGFDGDTGATIFEGGGTALTTVLRWVSPIVVNGRFFVGATNQLYAFNLPTAQ